MKRTAAILVMFFAIVLMLNTVTASYSYVGKYAENKTYKLVGDGGIYGTAKITCWQYDKGDAKVHTRVDVLKAYHFKGNKILSAWIIDLEKNGPESYIQIDKPKRGGTGGGGNRSAYDYVGFSQQFSEKDFPAPDDVKPCPIDSVGRIVVVVGTSPPKDSDTLSKGTVDVIAEAALSTSDTQPESTTGDTGVSSGAEESVGKEEPEIGTEEPKVEVEEPKVKLDPYSMSEPKLADPFGEGIDEIVSGQPVVVQTKVTNNLNEQQSFVYILQVKDSEGFTVTLTWIKGIMNASDSLDAGISWIPEESGNYRVEIFVWKSLEDPGLPLTKSMIVSVEE